LPLLSDHQISSFARFGRAQTQFVLAECAIKGEKWGFHRQYDQGEYLEMLKAAEQEFERTGE